MRPALIGASICFVMACQADPGRDVRPMADPLRDEATVSDAPLEILPLDDVRKSQAGAVAQRVANTEITVTYSRPVARGRTLFGALVPYDEVWNPGADQATTVAFTRDVFINDRPLPAGKYSLWIVPRSERATVIFSTAAEVYHTPYPGEDLDALRFDVRPERSARRSAHLLVPDGRGQGGRAPGALGRMETSALASRAVTAHTGGLRRTPLGNARSIVLRRSGDARVRDQRPVTMLRPSRAHGV